MTNLCMHCNNSKSQCFTGYTDSTVTSYSTEIMKVFPKISAQNQPNICFVTHRQDWLGIAKNTQKRLQISHKPFHETDMKF